MRLPPPATGVELYLAAILDELRNISAAVGDRGLARFVDERISEALGEVAKAVQYADGGIVPPAEPAPSPTKRTRARTPR